MQNGWVESRCATSPTGGAQPLVGGLVGFCTSGWKKARAASEEDDDNSVLGDDKLTLLEP